MRWPPAVGLRAPGFEAAVTARALGPALRPSLIPGLTAGALGGILLFIIGRYPPAFGLPITVSDFGPGMRYSGLARLLGVPRRELAQAEVIAFEGNAGGPAGVESGWESSIWTFTDGVNTYVAHFNEKVGRSSDPSVIATGSLGGVNFQQGGKLYSDFFRVCNDPTNKVVSFILFDLSSLNPPIDVNSPQFSIKLDLGYREDGSFGEGSPDLDAVGILSRCR